MKPCKHCGAALPNNAVHCAACGSQQQAGALNEHALDGTANRGALRKFIAEAGNASIFALAMIGQAWPFVLLLVAVLLLRLACA
jgi:uncharacterized membrane protein YvbJ